ncbi:(d)CMP kinase [Solibaculum mannosilyticum]|uniref:Cytidylate kinase n=1 Tax=Solibaculum mannosilyticum TaxID=2780922 RepID=A0A7I8D6X9_9FIRM|nr:(d)CMP kinase [Solibaculum mannosilyticum]BCI60973.1 cytidylate kinase [Solibaculum mannosilyticum]
MIAIAIDGPAGAGKSSVARKVAAKLGYIYVDTGALYRTIGYAVLHGGKDPKDAEAVVNLLPSLKVELAFAEGEQQVLLNGENVSDRIRTPEVSMAASEVSAMPPVREFLFSLQQNMAKTHDVIMDGRDIGTKVLPWAQVKIFLTASPEERARRRYEELVAKGQDVRYEDVLEDMKQRDYNDSHRAVAPLKPAEDAVIVDTTGNTFEQSVELLTNLIKERLA